MARCHEFGWRRSHLTDRFLVEGDPFAHGRVIAVSDGIEEQPAQLGTAERFAEHVEDLSLVGDALLLDPVRVPWHVVVDNQVRALQIDTLARRKLGRDEHKAALILGEARLDSSTDLAWSAS